MKSIYELLGGMQILLGLSYDLQAGFEEYLSEEQRAFLAILRVIEEHLSAPCSTASKFGRPAYQSNPFIRAFLAKAFFRILTTDDLRKRLLADPNLRMICGFTKVPSLPTFSRRMSLLSESFGMAQSLEAMATDYYAGKIVGHISRDSTAIAAREKPCNKKSEVAISKPVNYRRGRPRKGEERPQKALPAIAQQTTMPLEEALKTLDTRCAWGCKKNSQGNSSYWKGYKLHLDVTDCGIPISAVVTGANVHDSQVAIPLERMTETRVIHLYSLMDAAYDSDTIRSFIQGKNRVPLIDHNKRRNDTRPPFDPASKRRYAIRTTVERANAHLKDWFLSSPYFVRGIKKVSFQIMCGVLCLTALKILHYFIAPSLTKSA
ncbi:MAG: transposase [Rectinema sp.]